MKHFILFLSIFALILVTSTTSSLSLNEITNGNDNQHSLEPTFDNNNNNNNNNINVITVNEQLRFQQQQHQTKSTTKQINLKQRTYDKALADFAECTADMARKYDVKMFITDGTLLGQVRLHGFIDWDSDTDIAYDPSSDGNLQRFYDEFDKAKKEIASCSEMVKMEKWRLSAGAFYDGFRMFHSHMHPVETKSNIWMDLYMYKIEGDHVDLGFHTKVPSSTVFPIKECTLVDTNSNNHQINTFCPNDPAAILTKIYGANYMVPCYDYFDEAAQKWKRKDGKEVCDSDAS